MELQLVIIINTLCFIIPVEKSAGMKVIGHEVLPRDLSFFKTSNVISFGQDVLIEKIYYYQLEFLKSWDVYDYCLVIRIVMVLVVCKVQDDRIGLVVDWKWEIKVPKYQWQYLHFLFHLWGLYSYCIPVILQYASKMLQILLFYVVFVEPPY